MAVKKSTSKPASLAVQKTIPAALVISEARESLERAETHLTALDGMMGIFGEVDRAAEYVKLSDIATGFGFIIIAIRSQIKAIRENLGKMTVDGHGNAIGIESEE